MPRKSKKQIEEELAAYNKGIAFMESEIETDNHILMTPSLKQQLKNELHRIPKGSLYQAGYTVY